MPASPKRRTPPQERHAFGLTILAFSHPEVRRLQPAAGQPVLHGPKVWPTSFVLIDYLSQRGVPARARVLDLDVHFISSLPVILRSACKAWVDREPVQMVAAED